MRQSARGIGKCRNSVVIVRLYGCARHTGKAECKANTKVRNSVTIVILYDYARARKAHQAEYKEKRNV